MALELEMLEHRRVYDKGIAVRIRDFCFGDPNPEGLLAGVRWSQIGPTQTCRTLRAMTATRGKAEIVRGSIVRNQTG
jgi:hypothetical protein